MLHGSPDFVIHRTEIWAVWRPQVGRKKVWLFLTQQFNRCTCAARCADALSVLVEHKVVTRHSAYPWQQHDVIMTSWSNIEEVSKRYCQNFLLCNNNEITACIADLFNSFCEEVNAVAFFKVVQQQTVGEVGNSLMYLWADNFSATVKELLKSDSVCKSYAQMKKGPVFYSQCTTIGMIFL